MGTTSLGIVYPDSTAHTRIWEHLETLADDVNGLLVTIKAAYEGAWSSYTPAWTSTGTAPALGNGTLTGAYERVGNTVSLRAVLTLGSTSTVGTGTYRLSLPVAPKVGSLLTALFKDASASGARYSGTVEIVAATTTGDNMRIHVGSGTVTVGATVPVVPANGDELYISGTYEAA